MTARETTRSGPAAPSSVEILIVNYNTARLLADCLESIRRQLPPSDTARVTVSVLDNASSDGSAAMIRARFPNVRLVESQENIGFARANNRLAQEATAEYLVLLNSDTRFSEDVITPLLRAMGSSPGVTLVAPRLVYPDGDPQFSSERFPALRYELARTVRGTKAGLLFSKRVETTLARFRRQSETENRASHSAEFVWATCWMLRREDVRRHGLFGEDFVTYDEDLDFCRRLQRRGGMALYVASTELVHIGGASSSTEAKQRMVRAARRRYYRRHAGPVQAAAYWLLVTSTDQVKRGTRSPLRVRVASLAHVIARIRTALRMLVQRANRWKVWHLDGELRYVPVVAALPDLDLPICEVGSGPQGIAAWTPRQVIGIDPGSDQRHGQAATASNLSRLEGDGAHIPLHDGTASAALAVDTFEHIPREQRAAVVTEMKRVVRSGGRLIIMGPTGEAAAQADARVLERWRERRNSTGVVEWLTEHQQFGLPSVDELVGYVGTERVRAISVRGVFNVRLWWLMHRAVLGDFSRSRPAFLLLLLVTRPFAAVARRWNRGPFYRYLLVAELT